jgi:Mycothiol maleylpyruvate isomerase N-terminal domain/DinB superfamily
MTAVTAVSVDLRRSPLATIRAVDFRSPARDFWADEAATWDRWIASWAGLDDAAWKLPGAAPSDAGGPDWSLQEHVGHIADWQEIAATYVGRVLDGGRWPADDDYEGGDFDRFNEGRRADWAMLPVRELLARLTAAREELVRLVRQLPADTIRTDEAWGWVYMVLHGHVLDHLGVVEPWADRLRTRQVEGEPFLADPRPAGDGSPAAIARFWAVEASVLSQFDELVRPVPHDRWDETGPTEDWTLKDHVAHLASWLHEGAAVVDEHGRTRTWRSGPAEGIDAWNAQAHAANRGLTPAEALARFDAGRERLTASVKAMAPADLASPEGGEWAYECLHGHIRAHLAMVGPWCARIGWPAPSEAPSEGQ